MEQRRPMSDEEKALLRELESSPTPEGFAKLASLREREPRADPEPTDELRLGDWITPEEARRLLASLDEPDAP